MEPKSTRARRALTLIGLATVAVTAAGAVYLGPGLVRSASHQPPTPTAAPRLPLVVASFGDADHGAVTMGGPFSPAIYETSNGGRTWTKQQLGALTMTFLDREHAVAWGPGQLETTADSGRTWRSCPPPFSSGPFDILIGAGVIGGPTFLDPTNAWWLDAGPGPPTLWHSIDGGSTWRRLAGAGIPSGQTLGQPVFIDPLRGAIVMSGLGTDSWPSILTTQDAGGSWREVSLPASPMAGAHLALAAPVAAILLAHEGDLVLSLITLPPGVDKSALGPFGDAHNRLVSHWSSVSRDGGLTWWPWAAVPTLNFSTLSWPAFDDTGRLLLVDDQRLWISTDEGRTWQGHAIQMPPGERTVALFSARGGALFALAWHPAPESLRRGPSRANSGQLGLLRSRDGGDRWIEVALPRS
jgi:hypothetical protein